MPRDATAGPEPNRCCVFCKVSTTGSLLRASISCGIGSTGATDGAACAHRGSPAATKPAAADPESSSAWRRVSDVLIDMESPLQGASTRPSPGASHPEDGEGMDQCLCSPANAPRIGPGPKARPGRISLALAFWVGSRIRQKLIGSRLDGSEPLLCLLAHLADESVAIRRAQLRDRLGIDALSRCLVFVERPQRVLSRDQLLDLARGRAANALDRSIDTQASRLRRKLDLDPGEPRIIRTVWGGGYVFTPAVSQQ